MEKRVRDVWKRENKEDIREGGAGRRKRVRDDTSCLIIFQTGVDGRIPDSVAMFYA